jgi:hypothetical protein
MTGVVRGILYDWIRSGTGVCMDAVSLQDFERGGAVRVVRHGYGSWSTCWHPPVDEPWEIIARAEFLLKLRPRLPYNLIGQNCEIIANMCASGGWTESYQARRYFTAREVVDMPLMFGLASRSRAKLSTPHWVLLVVAGVLLSIGVKATYHYQIKLFWDEIRREWSAHERMLAEDPSNNQARRSPNQLPRSGFRVVLYPYPTAHARL